MNRELLYLGSAPCEEEPVQLGHPDYHKLGFDECQQFIKAIRKVCGPEPEHARLRVLKQSHDFGAYYEVAIDFDPADAAAAAYAHKVDAGAPVTWADAGMSAPNVPALDRGRT